MVALAQMITGVQLVNGSRATAIGPHRMSLATVAVMPTAEQAARVTGAARRRIEQPPYNDTGPYATMQSRPAKTGRAPACTASGSEVRIY